MRIHFRLSQNTSMVPFAYQEDLIRTFHRWTGPNEIHDDISLYSLSWLQGSKSKESGLEFPNGGSWFLSCWEKKLCKKIIDSARETPEVCFGMTVESIQIQETPEFSGYERFKVASPILIRKTIPNGYPKHLTFKDSDAAEFMTATMKRKMEKAGLDGEISIKFDKYYAKAKTKLITIHGIESRANFCPIIIEGEPDLVKFAWNVGVGNSTGSCFGSLY